MSLAPWLVPVARSLINRKQQQVLHHGLIFSGRRGIGALSLSQELAMGILCQREAEAPCGQCQSCKLFSAGSHPDYTLLVTETRYGVDLIREAIEKLSKTAQLGGAKVLLIPEAHRMTVAAANALLKTLEEPTKQTYILLTSHLEQEQLLPTVLSRCEQHAVSVSDKQQVGNWLQQQGIHLVPSLFDLYWQSPYFIVELYQENNEKLLEFMQGLQDQKTLPAVLPEFMLDHTGLLLDWMQMKLLQTMRDDITHVDALAKLQKLLIEAIKTLQQPGVNKKLQFSQCLREFNSFYQP